MKELEEDHLPLTVESNNGEVCLISRSLGGWWNGVTPGCLGEIEVAAGLFILTTRFLVLLYVSCAR